MTVAAKYLPADLVSDILSRLPLKSLVRFRETEGSESKLYSFGGGHQEDSFRVAVAIDCPLIRGKPFEIKTGCCHGMLCLSIEDNILVLWNPSIGDCRTIPLPEEIGVCGGVCGLGFDPSIDDYKVVSFCEKQVFIFSMKTSLWRNLGELPYSLFYEGVPANGCLYWAASKSHTFADRIICLNLSDETFREVSPPPFDPSISRPIWFQEEDEFVVVAELNLLLWGDSVCVFRQYEQTLWVMKEEKEENGGVRVIWTKMMTIPKISNQESRFRIYYHLHPKCFTKSGKLVVSVMRKWFVMYDGQRYHDLHIEGLGDGHYQKAIVYTESLISPNSIRGMNDID
ncbi:putative F-box protein At3g16210 [Manihot esculenta]|uniref:F-box associated beta-propeller type 1 domain-containing protein n=1 Tax=Manihot esculenta TaxID=3983 RepID=A0A2C9UDE2_MANES|nr:putative F-box protein At3g16210 [Manihot esculenta]OAY27908.1 hypothetical protein MANES_15G025900v8 [Manihot esculenta]